MQQSFIALAVAGLAFCTPIRRDLAARDLVMVTKYATVVETDVVYSTVWVDPTSVETPTATVTQAAVETTPTAVAPAVTPAVTPAAAPPAAATTSAIIQSAAQAPAPVQPSSSAQAATTPAPAPVAPPASSAPASSSAAPAPAPPSTGGKGGPAAGTTATGQITYYDVGLGACGETSTADQPVVAISKDVYDQYGFSNSDPVCGRKVAITYDGQTKEATVVDRCVGCAPGDLDLSRSLFESLAGSLDKGRISGVQWKWM